jgi:hypothetical protein
MMEFVCEIALLGRNGYKEYGIRKCWTTMLLIDERMRVEGTSW